MSAKSLRALHGWLTVLWTVMLPVAILTGWIYVVAYVSVISIYANVAGHFAAWQAARTEVKQDDA